MYSGTAKSGKTIIMKKFTSSTAWIFMAMIFLAALTVGCNGSKGLAKKGIRLQEAGLNSDAADFFYRSLVKNRNNVKARIGLTSSGQFVLDQYMEAFKNSYASGNDGKAVYAYLDAKDYYRKIEKLGVSLSWPHEYDNDYITAKNVYVDQLYSTGTKLLQEKQFNDANSIFSEILNIDPHYKDVGSLQNYSQNEPIYLSATSLIQQQKYRNAYYQLENIYRFDPNYKDVSFLLNQCLEKGQFPIGVLPLQNTSLFPYIEKDMQTAILAVLTSSQDPFLKALELNHHDIIYQGQVIQLNNKLTPQIAREAGQALGVKALLTGTLISYQPQIGKPQPTIHRGFEEIKTTFKDEETGKKFTETTYKEVSYIEFYNRNDVKLTFQYKVISLETGEVLLSKLMEDHVFSDAHYAVFNGEITRLYPADKNGIIKSSSAKNRLLDLFRAPRQVVPVEELAKEIFYSFSDEIARELIYEMNK